MVEIGELIKNTCYQKGIKAIQLANAIGTTRQNINGIFKRNSIDTIQLLKISNYLNYNFFKHYKVQNDESTSENKEIRNLKINIINLEKDLEEAQKEILLLREITNLQRKQLNTKNK